MKPIARLTMFVIVLAAIFLAACSPAATQYAPVPTESSDFYEEMPVAEPTQGLMRQDAFGESESAQVPYDAKAAPGEAAANGVIDTENTTLPDVPPQQEGGGNMIIKNAEVRLQVEDTDTAIDRSTQIVGDLGGYIISSRVWYQDYNGSNYKYATISIGIPVDEFENAMRRLRMLAIRVLDENASGQDVSAEFVDLQSKLGNLEATRDRIRSFLEDATTVEESLNINRELSAIDDQIEQVKGRMNFLSGRSAFSTITINLEPKLPELTPTPTPTLRPTATPTVWNPGETFENAQTTVTGAYQGIVEALIWVLVFFIPVFAPPAIIIWLIWKFVTRKTGKPAGGG